MKKRYEVGLEKLAFAASQVRKGRGEGGEEEEEEGKGGEKGGKGEERLEKEVWKLNANFTPTYHPLHLTPPHPHRCINAKRTGRAPAEAGDSS